MRWTPEKDQLLFTILLDTHSVTVNGRIIAAKWPTEAGEDPPTAKAITERVAKIRKQAGSSTNGAATTSASGAAAKSKGVASKTKAPTKTTATKDKTAVSRKRKASTVMPTTESSDMDDGEEQGYATPVKKRSRVKTESTEHDSLLDGGYPYSPAATPGNDMGFDGTAFDAPHNDIYDSLNMEGYYGTGLDGCMSSSLG